jgi:hypothetical protein
MSTKTQDRSIPGVSRDSKEAGEDGTDKVERTREVTGSKWWRLL